MESKKIYDSFEQKRKVNEMKRTINHINEYYEDYKAMLKNERYSKDTFFKSATNSFRKELNELMKKGISEEKALEKVLPKAYGLVKLACETVLGKKYYDVQLMSGIILNESYVAEMATGEGKTITAALPVYLNALLGKGAHVVTPNVYLASRDYKEMKPLFELLGLSCGLIEELNPNVRLQKVQARAKLIVEEARKKRYYSPTELEALKRKAFKMADNKVLENDIRNRQIQYNCDVTYGSSHAFAFDYLYDLLEDDPKKLRLRLGNPNYLVIDEADAVLFDDAITSYNISGIQKDSLFAISNQEKLSTIQDVRLATKAMNFIMGQKSLLKEIPESYDYQKVIEQDEKITESSPAIYYCPKKKDYHITELGNVILYEFFKNKELFEILNRNQDRILKMTYKGSSIATKRNGRIEITPRNLGLLIQSNKVKELRESYESFMSKERQNAFQDITNAAYAWLFLQKDIDYKYTIPSNSAHPEYERKISILVDGRVAEGRVYSNGMQQAVEEKEKILIKKRNENIVIKESDITDTLASIPVAAFFGRYNKFSGMTGTSAKDAFHDLYKLETFTIPRNKPYNVKDHGERLYPTKEDKYKAILIDVIKTHRKGQPILLTTTSMGESTRLYNYLMNGLRKNGISVSIPVLNANVNALEQEAEIIAYAGKRGAITIATDMAGRGTDIKLGGKYSTKAMEKDVLETGGLKIIGSGHFKYNRSDRQMNGRTGRQGNVGEIVYYNDLEDLHSIGVNPQIIKNFQNMMKNGPIIEEEMGSNFIHKVIEGVQAKNEMYTKEGIEANQRTEMPIAYCRNKYHDMMENIKLNSNYEDVIDKMIQPVLSDIFRTSLGLIPITGEIPENSRTSKLNIPVFQSLVKEYLGFQIKEEAFKNFKTIKDLREFVERVSKKRLQKVEISKELVDSHIHRIWHYFENYVENIKTQYFLATLTPGGEAPSKLDGQICDAYLYSYHTGFSQIVREVMHPIREKENDHFGIYKLQLNSDSTVKFIDATKNINRNESYISDEDPCSRKVR